MNEKYEKIINIPHHISKTHAQMERINRAAQFAPYSALSGYEDAVVESARLTDQKIELDEYEKQRINSSLNEILMSPPGTQVSITYFLPDRKKAGGAYITVTGEVVRVSEHKREITLAGAKPISFDLILDIQKTRKF